MRKTIVVFAAFFLGNSILVSAQESSKALPHILVYKTKGEYKSLVPVQLSDDRTRVISYPDPKDIKTGSSAGTGLPVLLHNGYWLDKTGIGVHTAFIKLTYAQYGKLKKTPSETELYKMVLDKEPLKELCDCGSRGAYSVKQLNSLIDKKQLRKKCKVLK